MSHSEDECCVVRPWWCTACRVTVLTTLHNLEVTNGEELWCGCDYPDGRFIPVMGELREAVMAAHRLGADVFYMLKDKRR